MPSLIFCSSILSLRYQRNFTGWTRWNYAANSFAFRAVRRGSEVSLGIPI